MFIIVLKWDIQACKKDSVLSACLPFLRLVVQTPDFMWKSWKLLTDGQQFTVQNLEQQYVLVSSAKTKLYLSWHYLYSVESYLKSKINN